MASFNNVCCVCAMKRITNSLALTRLLHIIFIFLARK
uniref:Uncharacterized protein n=1 Tax=Arundo donax TaxID=35708 RepID=A0A0A8Y222_ARUDO